MRSIGIVIISICMLTVFVPLSGAQTYWGKQVVESTMTRYTPAQLGSWTYHRGFYLFGQYRLCKLTGDDRYLQYIQDWLDLHVDSDGHIDQTINSLDNSEPALINLLIYNETGQEKYKQAADYVRDIYHTYPRTSDGGFWHGMGMTGQLWLDGVYMCTPFLAHYAHTFGDIDLFDEVTKQIMVYASHLQDTSGLMFHAYDEDGSSDWADRETHHSPHFWGRSMGWFGMAIIEILEVLPETHPNRDALIRILADLIAGLSQVQDEATGLWYQVPNLGDNPDNWLESSCSCMYSFFTARAVQKGYVDPNYLDMAVNGYKGVLQQKIYFTDNLINLKDICIGTGVSADVDYYFNRARNTNDLHGLGAFLMMCWQMDQMDDWIDPNQPPFVQILSPFDPVMVWPGTALDIEAQAFDLDGEVVQVDFYADDQLIASLTEPPWRATWRDIPEGTFHLTAQAHDNTGLQATSAAITVIVTKDVMIVEAESGILSAGSIDNNHAGFSGEGFVNFTNRQGTYLDLPIYIPQSGYWRLSIRYANGSGLNRPCEIHWDNQVLQNHFDFPATDQWSSWQYSSPLEISTTSGDHMMHITGVESSSGPNIDHVQFIFLGSN